MRLFSTFLFVFTIALVGFSQNDSKAKSIIDKLSTKTKSYKTIYVEFTAKIKNSSIDETSKGKGWMKGDKYKAQFGEYNILSNGTKVWTISTADKETYVSNVGDDDDDMVNPQKLLKIWEDGYKYKYVKEVVINGAKHHVINLFPKNPKDAKFHTVTMTVNAAKSQIYRVVMKSNDATTSTYTMNVFKVNATYTDAMFVYDKRKYPGYEVIN